MRNISIRVQGCEFSRLNCNTTLLQDVPDSLVFGKTYDKGGFQKAVENNLFISQRDQSCYLNSSRTQYETPFGTILGFNSIHFTECLLSLHNNQPFEFVSYQHKLFWRPSEGNERELRL